MKFLQCSHLWQLLALHLAIAYAQVEPPGPVHPGTPSGCNKWHVVETGDSCPTVQSLYDITADDFFGWNPAVSRDCTTNFWGGYAYCVGVGASDEPTTTTQKPSITAEPTPPGPTFTGSPNNCNSWYLIQSGDDCDNVPKRFGITRAEFLEYNPAISKDCTINFWVGQAYCVGTGPPVTITATSASTSTSSVATSETSSFNSTYSIKHPITTANLTVPTLDDTWPPVKTQEGQPSYCSNWHRVAIGETCVDIVREYGNFMSLADFFAWNPVVGTDCSGLYLDYFVCVGIKVQTTGVVTIPDFAANFTLPPYVSWSEPPLPSVDPSFAPTPSHGPMPTDCLDYAQAKKGFTCEDMLEAQPMMSREQFFAWNPVLDGNCDGLWANNYYCVAAYAEGMLPQPPTVDTEPAELPEGVTTQCVTWYESTPGDSCALIAAMFGSFSEADFKEWNPSVGADCVLEEEGTWYCVGIPGTPTTRTSPVEISTSVTTGTNSAVPIRQIS